SEPVTDRVHVNEPPVAALQVVPGSCLDVTWASATSDCDLTNPSPDYAETVGQEIDFGDGSPPGSGTSGSHLYAGCGTYVLTLTATDASGCISMATREVTFTG